MRDKEKFKEDFKKLFDEKVNVIKFMFEKELAFFYKRAYNENSIFVSTQEDGLDSEFLILHQCEIVDDIIDHCCDHVIDYFFAEKMDEKQIVFHFKQHKHRAQDLIFLGSTVDCCGNVMVEYQCKCCDMHLVKIFNASELC